MAKADNPAKRVDEICLSLPDTSVSLGWGSPHYKVMGKIFAGCDDKSGTLELSVRLDPGHTDVLLASDPRFKPSRYKGAVQFDLTRVKNWGEVRELVIESYRSVAPKKSLAKLDAAAPAAKPLQKKEAAAKKAAPQKKAATTKTSKKRAAARRPRAQV